MVNKINLKKQVSEIQAEKANEHAYGCVANFIRRVCETPKEDGYTRVYRGQTDNWNLIPGLYRGNYESKEREILDEVQRLYPYEFAGCQTLFDILIKAQHYGIPTRILDVTFNPLVALFFAVQAEAKSEKKGTNSHQDPKKSTPVVHIIDIPDEYVMGFNDPCLQPQVANGKPSTIDYNESSRGESLFIVNGKPAQFICVKPQMNNDRIVHQQAAALLFNNVNTGNSSRAIKQKQTIYIHKPALKRIREELHQIGISNEFLFPELSTYAEVLKERANTNISNKTKRI